MHGYDNLRTILGLLICKAALHTLIYGGFSIQILMSVPLHWMTVMSMRYASTPLGATCVYADKDTMGMVEDAKVLQLFSSLRIVAECIVVYARHCIIVCWTSTCIHPNYNLSVNTAFLKKKIRCW